MSTSVDTPLSPTLSVEVVDALGKDFQIGANADGPVYDPGFSAARQAMQSLRASAELLADAEGAVKGAKDATNERRLRTGAESKLNAARKAMESGLTSIAARREAVEAEIDGALGLVSARTELVPAMRSGEIRAYFQRLSADDRFALGREAIAAGDIETVSAILSVTPIASGLSRDKANMLRMMAEQKFAPGKVALRAGLDKLSSALTRAGGVITDRFGGLVGQGDGRDARAQRALKALEGGAA